MIIIFFDEIYKFKSSKKAPVIYDCGTNIGMSCLYFKKLYPEAIIRAFEPEPHIFKILVRNLEANGLKDIEALNKAVWRETGKLEFGREGADGGSIYRRDNTVEVESVRLKDLIEKEAEIDILKLDVEGAETEVICDCSEILGKINNIFIEYHAWNDREQELDNILKILSCNNSLLLTLEKHLS